MCDCVSSTLTPNLHTTINKLGFTKFNHRPKSLHIDLTNASNTHRNGGKINLKLGVKASVFRSEEKFEFYNELGFLEKDEKRFEFDNVDLNSRVVDDADFELAELKDALEDRKESLGESRDEELVRIDDSDCADGSLEVGGKRGVRSRRQVMARSSMIAKQVISMESALSLGFVSQLWVDTNSWVVLVVEVRPNLLSGELERLLLEDIIQVGDVVLVQNESVAENDYKMAGLETLVGYNVATPGRRNIGKVRGYSFNINSGAVETLELDSFGISLIPSSLVSTYALFVEDVVEVVSDTVVVHEAAASRIQRLTKGLWDTQQVGNSLEDLRNYSNTERRSVRTDPGGRRSFNSKRFRGKVRDNKDDWELPMDYL